MAEMRHGARGNYRICKAGPDGKPCAPCRDTELERLREWRRNRRAQREAYTPAPKAR